MAFSSANLSSDEITWASLDKPFLSNNALYNTSTAAGWDAGTVDGTVASATEDATGFDAERLFNIYPGLTSKPNAAGTVHTIVFDRSGTPITFDWLGVLTHNLDTLACTDFTLQIANDAAFTSGLLQISTTNVATALSSDRRFADLSLVASTMTTAQDETAFDNSPTTEGTFAGGASHAGSDVITLVDGTTVTVDAVSGGAVTQFTINTTSSVGATKDHTLVQASTTGSGTGFTLTPDTDNLVESTVAKRFSSVPYIRLQITCSSGTPEIGLIVLGRRRQQQFSPDMPWDPTNEVTDSDDHTSKSGVISRVSRAKARRDIDALFRHDTTAEQTTIKDWWSDIEGGVQPFFYVDEPNANPNNFWMMFLVDPRLSYPFNLHATRDVRIEAIEQGPSGAYFSQE